MKVSMKKITVNKTKAPSVKILFRFFNDVLDEWTVETIWAEPVNIDKGLYKLDNIPFYAGVASGDIVVAEYDQIEKMLAYRYTVEYSGNSTIQVVMMDTRKDINTIREIFNELGCPSERLNNRYFAMEIPADKDYSPIKKKLKELQESEIIAYAEPCLSENHQYATL